MTPRLRLVLLWGLFLGAAGVAAFAVHRLYRTARQEILAQGERAVQSARVEAERRVGEYLDETRRTILTELAGFHEDGLVNSLQRWNAANEVVRETFLWDEQRGFLPVPGFASAAPTAAGLPEMWREFAEWRTAHPDLLNRDPVLAGVFQVAAFRTLDNPSFSAAGLRYQAENLDMLRDAGRVVDPWAGWAAANTSPGGAWFFWYQTGPGATVRGCTVSPALLVKVLSEELDGDELVRTAIIETGDANAATFDGAVIFGLPGYRLQVELGEVFAQKAADARLSALVAGALLGLFLLGTAALTVRTWREARDAGRKINFVTQVSHELRTPLTSIRMFADMLGAGELPPEKRLKFAGNIATESARLSALIERLLAFNTLEKGGRVVQVGPLEIGAVVEEVVSAMAPTLEAAGLGARLDLPAGSLVAIGDHSTLKQAMLNLLENAAKYAPGSGEVTISARREDGPVCIRVTDAGPGVPPAIRGRLFEPFVQGGQTLTTKSPGVGLGLSLARGLLRQIGGDLIHVPTVAGAVFEIRLPAASTPPASS